MEGRNLDHLTKTGKDSTVPGLIAHRGYAASFPENTLLSLEMALRSGTCFIEFDVQFCTDGIPVLFHDQSLERMTGLKKDLSDLSYKEVKKIQVRDTTRFGNKFMDRGIGIPMLSDVVQLLKYWPDVTVFVDVKKESLEKYSIEQPIKTVMQIIKPVFQQCCIVSKMRSALALARELGAMTIGWVLEAWTEGARSQAEDLSPDYLFCNYKKIPLDTTDLWPGSWQWCLYEVVDPEFVLALHAKGADLIETMDIGNMLRHPLLCKGEMG